MRTAKSEIFAAAIAKHQSVIDDFTRRVKDLMANDGNVNEEEYDNSEQAIRADRIREVELLNKELEFAQEELKTLTRLQRMAGRCIRVTPGAVVKTDGDSFFISASIEDFKVNGSQYFGVSTQSPIYKAMKGKRIGDSVKVGKWTYKILDIY